MRLILAISLLTLLALVWMVVAVVQHLGRARRRRQRFLEENTEFTATPGNLGLAQIPPLQLFRQVNFTEVEPMRAVSVSRGEIPVAQPQAAVKPSFAGGARRPSAFPAAPNAFTPETLAIVSQLEAAARASSKAAETDETADSATAVVLTAPAVGPQGSAPPLPAQAPIAEPAAETARFAEPAKPIQRAMQAIAAAPAIPENEFEAFEPFEAFAAEADASRSPVSDVDAGRAEVDELVAALMEEPRTSASRAQQAAVQQHVNAAIAYELVPTPVPARRTVPVRVLRFSHPAASAFAAIERPVAAREIGPRHEHPARGVFAQAARVTKTGEIARTEAPAVGAEVAAAVSAEEVVEAAMPAPQPAVEAAPASPFAFSMTPVLARTAVVPAPAPVRSMFDFAQPLALFRPMPPVADAAPEPEAPFAFDMPLILARPVEAPVVEDVAEAAPEPEPASPFAFGQPLVLSRPAAKPVVVPAAEAEELKQPEIVAAPETVAAAEVVEPVYAGQPVEHEPIAPAPVAPIPRPAFEPAAFVAQPVFEPAPLKPAAAVFAPPPAAAASAPAPVFTPAAPPAPRLVQRPPLRAFEPIEPAEPIARQPPLRIQRPQMPPAQLPARFASSAAVPAAAPLTRLSSPGVPAARRARFTSLAVPSAVTARPGSTTDAHLSGSHVSAAGFPGFDDPGRSASGIATTRLSSPNIPSATVTRLSSPYQPVAAPIAPAALRRQNAPAARRDWDYYNKDMGDLSDPEPPRNKSGFFSSLRRKRA